MVEINYLGQTGNNLFQYVFARLLAIKQGLFLKSQFPHQDLIRTTEHEKGKKVDEPRCIVNDFVGATANIFFEKRISKGKVSPKHYIINGYFQNPNYYFPFFDTVKSFFILEPVEKNTEDIVITIRLGDYFRNNMIIHPQWYLDILEKEKFNRLHIVGVQPDEPYLDYFKKYNPIVAPVDYHSDFHYIRKFEKVICANGTYSWWACILGESKKAYLFKPWTLCETNKKLLFAHASQMSNFSYVSQTNNFISVDGKFLNGYNPKTFYQ